MGHLILSYVIEGTEIPRAGGRTKFSAELSGDVRTRIQVATLMESKVRHAHINCFQNRWKRHPTRVSRLRKFNVFRTVLRISIKRKPHSLLFRKSAKPASCVQAGKTTFLISISTSWVTPRSLAPAPTLCGSGEDIHSSAQPETLTQPNLTHGLVGLGVLNNSRVAVQQSVSALIEPPVNSGVWNEPFGRETNATASSI